MAFKTLAFLFLLVFVVSGCDKKPLPQTDAKTSAAMKSYENEVLDLTNYDSENKYFINNREHFKKFLDKYWDKLVIHNGYTKEEYITNFQERSLKPKQIEWFKDSIQNFKSKGYVTYSGKLFSFYFINRGKTKTIFYSHGNVSPFAYWAEFASSFSDRFQDYNVVMVHSTRINHEEKVYSADELNALFESDLKDFLVGSKLDKSQNYFNIVCHSALFTYKFFKDNPNMYEKVIYYAPMIKKSPDDIVQDFSKVFDPKVVMDEFYSVYYLYSLTTPRGTRTFPIPLVSLKFNIGTEKNLTDLYYKGLDITGLKNKSLIYADKESMLVDASYSMKDFNKKSIIKLNNMTHHDYFSMKDKSPQYFDSLEKLINQK